MKVYNETLYLVTVQTIPDNDVDKANIKIIPCKTMSAAKSFEYHLRNSIAIDDLISLTITESKVYGD